MEILLLILGVAALLVGLAGAVLPLPGPPLSFAGLLLLKGSGYADVSTPALVVIGVITLVITVLDYYVPIWGVRKFGGTSYGAWGTTLGLIVGLFIPVPGGLFLGAFFGAFAGELIAGLSHQNALKAAFGSFLGFLAGMFMKVMLCLMMIGYAVMAATT